MTVLLPCQTPVKMALAKKKEDLLLFAVEKNNLFVISLSHSVRMILKKCNYFNDNKDITDITMHSNMIEL
jgi:hypothetical protein